MRTSHLTSSIAGLALLLSVSAACLAQQPSSTAAASPMPQVGEVAPDFTFRGATRYGLLRDPMKLSDFRGQTVVLWLFIKARTRG